ncbi:hypothetical protein QTP88_008694 [Uroleucon formosanum]
MTHNRTKILCVSSRSPNFPVIVIRKYNRWTHKYTRGTLRDVLNFERLITFAYVKFQAESVQSTLQHLAISGIKCFRF